uniref:ATP synthase complex subunit 8 n=1 Tax=Stictocephala bisonia TaxID=1585304 RepID=A0A894JPF6_9HEMI|nr:ATP synthase F0 subunit 8 [Stictocephala bisonia]QRV59920.1 ATP synthase F0 subunit 8 [Stictocephala bisonia]
MPQMSPMWWMTLMLTFNSLFIVINSTTYFNYKFKNMSEKKTKKNKLNWKW